MTLEKSENAIRDLLMRVLYAGLGVKGSWQGEGKFASFDITGGSSSAVCRPEQRLDYALPKGGTLSHNLDILITLSRAENDAWPVTHIGIEVKHQSAVTDAFKCRAYDMLHLKQAFGTRFVGMLVYVRAHTGISFKQAEKICYPYDHFIGIEFSKIGEPRALANLVQIIAREMSIQSARSPSATAGAG